MADLTQMSIAPAAPAEPQAARESDRAKVKELAHQFEAMLMTQMLRSMRQSMLSDEESDGFGKSMMTDAFDTELGQSLSGAGGIGLSSVLIRAFDRQLSGAAPIGPAAATAVPEPPAPPAPGAAESAALPGGQITSGFGWRSDPFNGQAKFHSGTDVRMAYGQEVASAAAGRVSFVGQQGGYGLTVKVDHGNGLESRYAHLSSAEVRPGDPVGTGQVIARSGNSGHSTGPHLHFEVLRNGRAVDPIKGFGAVAD
jgi:murein DD-endopeptidase MepM/ murein hydrolase activator NlpD